MGGKRVTYETSCVCINCRLSRIEKGVYNLRDGIDALLKKYGKN